MRDTRLTLRVDFGGNRSIGPGKVRLLETIGQSGSIAQAGRELGMSYRRAWLLIDDMNQCLQHAVVTTQPGGTQGGGATLTEFGEQLIAEYRAIEQSAQRAATAHLRDLEASLRPGRPSEARRKTSIKVRTS